MSVRYRGVNRRVSADGNVLRGTDTRERDERLKTESIVRYQPELELQVVSICKECKNCVTCVTKFTYMFP